MKRISLITLIGWTILSAAISASGADTLYNVTKYGAKGDGKTLCTKSIQKTIDACAASGGGTVLLPAGTFLSGTIFLKSHVTIQLESGCTLLGSANLADYPENIPALRSFTDNYVNRSLIAGENLDNIAIRDRGTIDGNGAAYLGKPYLTRPYVVRIVNCRDVLVEGVQMKSSPMWMQHYLACERLTLRDITVSNHVNNNNDGVDIDGCRDVIVTGCILDSDDDALCLKSTLDRPSENVSITNCVLSSRCNAIKMGTESNGGFVNIAISNCTILAPRYAKIKGNTVTGLAGIALEMVDGGRMDGVAISNITIKGVDTPIFIRLGDRGRPFIKDMPRPTTGAMQNISLSQIIAVGAARTGCAISGVAGRSIENLSLSDIRIVFNGSGKAKDSSREIPELSDAYPECRMFGVLPAYGFYFRHVKGLKLRDVTLKTNAADQRHAVVLNDVEDATIDNLDAAWSDGGVPLLGISESREVLVRGCRPRAADGAFLNLDGAATRGVLLMSNDFSAVGKVAEISTSVSPSALTLSGNHPSGNASGKAPAK